MNGYGREPEDVPQSAPPGRRPGRWLRALIGIDESLLDHVWEERPRYTCLGATVLGTAVMAALAMLDAIDQVFGAAWPVAFLVALFWGALICAIDRWLMASSHGTRSGRWLIFVPRMILSLFVGVLITTPLVLTVFGPEVLSAAQVARVAAVQAYGSQLKQCNPLPSADPALAVVSRTVSCRPFHLEVANPAIATDRAINSGQAQLSVLKQTIAKGAVRLAQLNTVAQGECRGFSGAGLTGIEGSGPNCRRDRRQADAFASASHLGTLRRQASNLSSEIAAETATANKQTQVYANSITNAIATMVADKKTQAGRISLIDRIDAIGELASQNLAVRVAVVMLGIFVVAIDCLPVVSKLIGGTTGYDQILETRLRFAAEKMAAEAINVSQDHSLGSKSQNSCSQDRSPARSAERLLANAVSLLPERDRSRYLEEFRSELADIAGSGGGRRAQVMYALRQTVQTWRLRTVLRAPQRRQARP